MLLRDLERQLLIDIDAIVLVLDWGTYTGTAAEAAPQGRLNLQEVIVGEGHW